TFGRPARNANHHQARRLHPRNERHRRRDLEGEEVLNIEEWQSFLDYVEKVHGRTLRIARCIPADRLEWTYSEGKFTIGDLVRHLASINRYMYAENAQGLPSRYPGHGRELA